jgi:hypothetical protein
MDLITFRSPFMNPFAAFFALAGGFSFNKLDVTVLVWPEEVDATSKFEGRVVGVFFGSRRADRRLPLYSPFSRRMASRFSRSKNSHASRSSFASSAVARATTGTRVSAKEYTPRK